MQWAGWEGSRESKGSSWALKDAESTCSGWQGHVCHFAAESPVPGSRPGTE